MEEQDIKYRQLLQELENKAQDQYDKTVILLSTGALGISFTFIKDIVELKDAVALQLLIGAWIAWGLSAASVLLSFHTSRNALRNAIVVYTTNRKHPRNCCINCTAIERSK